MSNIEKAVKTTLARTYRTVDIIWALKKSSNYLPFYYQFFDKFTILYHMLRLWKQKKDLLDLLSVSPHINPEIFLEAGEFFHEGHDVSPALWCFNRTLEELKTDNQDIRLRALMGRLEILIDEKIKSPQKKSSVVLGELHDLIREDLPAVSYEIRRDLSGRLNRAKIQIGKIAAKLLAEDMKNHRMK